MIVVAIGISPFFFCAVVDVVVSVVNKNDIEISFVWRENSNKNNNSTEKN